MALQSRPLHRRDFEPADGAFVHWLLMVHKHSDPREQERRHIYARHLMNIVLHHLPSTERLRQEEQLRREGRP
jgi:hypothetical protein